MCRENVMCLCDVTCAIKKLSQVMRKPTFCICENKDADQLRGNHEAVQRLCFRYIHSTNPLLFMPPPFEECGRALSVAHVRPSVRPSVRPCVRPSVRPSFKWVLCERNSSYNFIPILLKLYRCFCQGLKMCMTFGYNPQINFCHFFHSLNLVIFGLSYY